jgi:hypothetical protein
VAGTITISYGAGTRANALPIALRAGAKLRLCDAAYPFAEPPDLIRLETTATRLAFLREHLQSLCDLWVKPPRQFLDAYFAWLAATLAAEPARSALTEAGHGLFAPEDWSFAALRPLPSAFLPAGDEWVRAEFAFWTGDGFVAVELPGERRAKRRDELAPADLVDATALGVKLPAAFHDFWRNIALPRSPFGMRDLVIAPAL